MMKETAGIPHADSLAHENGSGFRMGFRAAAATTEPQGALCHRQLARGDAKCSETVRPPPLRAHLVAYLARSRPAIEYRLSRPPSFPHIRVRRARRNVPLSWRGEAWGFLRWVREAGKAFSQPSHRVRPRSPTFLRTRFPHCSRFCRSAAIGVKS